MSKKILWSHSRLNLMLKCPMSYFLRYYEKIRLKNKKTPFIIGNAVHHGIEVESDKLKTYFEENGNTFHKSGISDDQLLSEAMVCGFLEHKEHLYKTILRDEETGGQLEVIEEWKEMRLVCNIPSTSFALGHEFQGIVDLLILTNKGFILMDNKTSSTKPDWNLFLDQVYRYCYLLKSAFPDIPIYKIGIINLKKSGIRRKSKENVENFADRLKKEYLINDDLIEVHMYNNRDMREDKINFYMKNLIKTLDFAQACIDNRQFYINYDSVNDMYGNNEYYEIFYEISGNFFLYEIRDKVFSEMDNKLVDYRDCVDIDMLTTRETNVLNKYYLYEEELIKFFSEELNATSSYEDFNNCMRVKYITNDNLLKMYLDTFEYNSREEGG